MIKKACLLLLFDVRERQKKTKKKRAVFFPLLPLFLFQKFVCIKMDVFLDVFFFLKICISLLIKKSTKSIYPLTTTTRTRNAYVSSKQEKEGSVVFVLRRHGEWMCERGVVGDV